MHTCSLKLNFISYLLVIKPKTMTFDIKREGNVILPPLCMVD